MKPTLHGRIGIALGTGAARGWAHIGVLRALEEVGVVPELICGSSIGAVVAAAFAAGRLDDFEKWARELDWRRVVGSLDLSLRGGLLKGRRVFELLGERLPDCEIADMDRAFGAVATELGSGQEVWLRDGSLHDALRASIALPGLITPARIRGQWLVDGGLVNPVPVSLCRAMGADTIIAVDLNTALLGRRFRARGDDARTFVDRALPAAFHGLAAELRARVSRTQAGGEEKAGQPTPPSVYEVIATSINIMQVRVARSRMAGDPPELLIAPRLDDFALFDFDRAAEAIEAGRRAVAVALASGSVAP